MLIRVSEIVSSSLPGIGRVFARRRASPAARRRRCPSTTSTPVTTSRPLTTCDPSRHAAALPSRSEMRVNVGTNAALIAPSANRSRSSVGNAGGDDEGVGLSSWCRRSSAWADVAHEAQHPARSVASADEAGRLRETLAHRVASSVAWSRRSVGRKVGSDERHGCAGRTLASVPKKRRGLNPCVEAPARRMDERLLRAFHSVRRRPCAEKFGGRSSGQPLS